MRRAALFLATVSLAGCGGAPDAAVETNVVETNLVVNDTGEAAAASAPADNELAPAPEATPAPVPTATMVPVGETAEDDGAAAGTPEAAAQLVERYYALIARGDYARAYRLWEDEGRASGMSEAAFADSFARYSEYRAEVRRPDRVDAGAGNRFATVPVRITGRLRDGNRPFVMEGEIVVHRNAEVPGTDAEDRRWRLRDADINPRPLEAAPTPTPTPTVTPMPEPSPSPTPSPTTSPSPTPSAAAESATRYRCVDGSRLVVRLASGGAQAVVFRGQARVATLARQGVGAGALYRGDGHILQIEGDAITLTSEGAPPIPCTVAR